jgi:hypothetical protein
MRLDVLVPWMVDPKLYFFDELIRWQLSFGL